MDFKIESSPVAETDEDFISGKFCECKHLIKEHSHGKCYALIDNGGIWVSCRCESAKPLTFQLRIPVEIENAKAA